MTYTPIAFRSFGRGLNLKDKTDAVSEEECIDCLNVEYGTTGAVQQRAGYAQFTGSELTNQPDSMIAYYVVAGTKRLVVGNGNRLDVLGTDGTSAANSTAPTASPHFFARFGGPTQEAVYIANGTDQVRRLVGTTFSTPAGLAGQTGKFVAVTPWDNRLAVARESGSTAGNNPSSVNFSDAGDPETFTAGNYIDLTPGDGEQIMGVVAWREYVFVFKESKFFRFYGTSTDSTGGAVFEYTTIDSGAGLVASKALATANEGVYFLARDGVYRTTGGEPQKVSHQIEPFFEGNTSLYFKSSTYNHGATTAAMGEWNDRIYLAVPTGSSATNDRMLVFDPNYGWWSLYDIAAAALTKFRIGNPDELVFAAPTGSNYIYRHSSSYLNDAMTTGGTGGTAVTARWRSGWFDYGSGEVKRIREAKVWGQGSVTYRVSKDQEDDAAGQANVTFGASTGALWDTAVWDTDEWASLGQNIPYLVRGVAARGAQFSVEFVNSTISTTFRVHRLEQHLAGRKITSTKQMDKAAA